MPYARHRPRSYDEQRHFYVRVVRPSAAHNRRTHVRFRVLFSGFFRGLAPGLVGIIPARSTYFFAYARSKEFWTNNARLGDRHRDLTEVLCGVTAGVVQNTITNPIWMVKTRMQVEKSSHHCWLMSSAPTGPHLPPRLARRPDRVRIGGALLRYEDACVCSASFFVFF